MGNRPTFVWWRVERRIAKHGQQSLGRVERTVCPEHFDASTTLDRWWSEWIEPTRSPETPQEPRRESFLADQQHQSIDLLYSLWWFERHCHQNVPKTKSSFTQRRKLRGQVQKKGKRVSSSGKSFGGQSQLQSISCEWLPEISYTAVKTTDRVQRTIARDTYAELTVEADHNDHVDEVAEEHRRVNISNEQGLFQLSVELDDRSHKITIAETRRKTRHRTSDLTSLF